MKITKLSELLALLGWVSVFTESWLLVTRQIPPDGLSWGFLGFFFITAVFASAIAAPRKTQNKEQ